MTILALAVLAVLVPMALFDLFFAPTVRRLGLRNVVRRKGEAALVIGGSMLATALIVASMVVGDSFGQSIRNLAQDGWGPIDELVVLENASDLDATQALLREQASPVDGVLAIRQADVAMGAVGDGANVEPTVRLFEADGSELAGFGGDTAATGFGSLASDVKPGEIVLNTRLADALAVKDGSFVDVYAGGQDWRMVVVQVVDPDGMAGLMEAVVGIGSFDDLVPTELHAGSIENFVVVSNAGDVFTGAERTDSVVESVDGLLSAMPGLTFEIETVKEGLLEDAEYEAADQKSLFGTIGGFSVAAGILLVINLFVMLASERKSELGVLRAVGIKRGQVLRAFALEGFVYGVLAAAAGSVLGIGVGAAVMGFASNTLGDGDRFAIAFSVVPGSVLAGAAIGLAISQLTVVFTSFRITKLNIVSALKDLPDTVGAEQSRRGLLLGVLGVVVGAGLFVLFNSEPLIAMLAPVIVLVGAVPFLGRVIPQRLATIGLSAAAIAWPALVFGLMPDTMTDPDISLFLLQGILMVGLATVLVAAFRPLWLAIASALSGGGVSMRLGLAHPLARPVRTALLVAMYSLVIFTVTFMAVMNTVFGASTPTMAFQAGGDYDVMIEANPGAELSAQELVQRSDFEAVVAIGRGDVEIVRDGTGPETENWRLQASYLPDDFDQVALPTLTVRADKFATDSDAWRAVLDGTDRPIPAVLVPDWTELEVGSQVDLVLANGLHSPVFVAGHTDLQWLVDGGLLASNDLAATSSNDASGDRFYAVVAEGVDADRAVQAIEADEVRRGVDATTFLAEGRAEVKEQEAFINILQGYLGLGLLIGIAGLGVVLARAVRERRRQIGMMRAVGFNGSAMRGAFIFEALFIGIQGVVLGVGLGLLSAWQILTQSTAFEDNLTFELPIWPLIVLAVVCLVASLGAALVPAIRSGRIAPAVALRL